MDFFENKNNEFYRFLENTFNLKKCKTWDEVSQQITIDKIKATYKFFSNLFPRKIDYTKEFKASNNFRTLHYGNLRGSSIINEIVRFSLYSDEILVFHPLQNPSITSQKFDPRKNPRYWMYDFLSALHFYIVLKKWVEAGIVKLIINPVDFDLELRNELHLKAIKRVENFLETHPDIDKGEATDNIAEHFSNFYGDSSVEYLTTLLLDMNNPKFTEEEALEFAKKIKAAYPKRNPLYKKLRVPQTNGIITDKSGASFEAMLYITNLSGSNIYTSKKTNWEMLKGASFNEFWLKFNYAYSKADLPFLTNVDTSFVLNVRKEDRLNKLRTKLKSIFSELEKLDISDVSDKKLFELNQNFIDSVKDSEADWLNIKKEAENQRRYWAGVSLAIPIVQHEVTIFSLLGSAAWLANHIRGEKIKINHFKKKDPLSVYVDLQHKDEGFFSDLRNCLF